MKKILLLFLTIILTSCLASNTAIESSISKKITNGLNTEKHQNNDNIYPKGIYDKIGNFNKKKTTSNIEFNQ